MTKRRNPFDECHVQRKMHIGIKEVNLGVNCEENMKKVYENTCKILFNGSQKNQVKSKYENGIPKVQNGFMNGNGYDSFHCRMNENTNSVASNASKNSITNPCCQLNQHIFCSFCERITCTNCCRLCGVCKFEFCHLCSILRYDSQEETAVCLSCM